MNFVYPQFLFALFAVSIPIIVHLFNFRRFKKVYFSDVRFLKEVKLQTQNRNRVKHLLILLMRILAVSFLVFAFAQPFIPNQNKNGAAGIQAVSIYVDNSFSMENVSKNGILLDESRKIAREIAMAHSQTDLFQLLTNDFEGRHQRLLSREEFFTLLDEVKISPAVKTVSEISARQSDLLARAEAKNKKAFIVSDFQRTVSDLEKVKPDTTVKTTLLPVTANQENNLYIDSCWFDSPVHQLDEAENLNVRIRNLSENDLENIPVKLFLNGQQKTPASFSIRANESKELKLSFVVKEPGIQQGRIEITDYPVTYDDRFYFSFNVDKNISVTCISSSSPHDPNRENQRPILSLFGDDSLFLLSVQDENRIDYASLASQRVIILAELKNISSGLARELELFVQNGGSLVVFPASETDTASYRSFLSSMGTNFLAKQDTANTKVDWINFEDDIFSEVFDKKSENLDLPVVHSHYSLSQSSRTTQEVLLRLKNNTPFFSKYSFRKGKVYLSAVPLNTEWSNLTKHAIFVPLMYRIAMNSRPEEELFYTVGKSNSIKANTKPGAENVFKIKGTNASGEFEVIPETRMVDLEHTIFVHGQIREAGNYGLYAGNELSSGLAFNYDRKESDLKRFTAEELNSAFENAGLTGFSLIDVGDRNTTKVLADIGEGKKLWKWCILLALLFLAAETALLRLFRT